MSGPTDRAHALLFDLKRPELAEKELRRALAANPSDAYAQTTLAHALGTLRRLEEAETAIAEAIRLAPDYAYAHRIRAWLCQLRGQYDAAAAAYREAQRLDPSDLAAYRGLAEVLYSQRQYGEALNVADEALALRADDALALNRRARALTMLNRLDEAQAAIGEALRIDPSSAVCHITQGWIWSRRSCTLRALRSYRTALQLDPADDWSRGEMRRLLLKVALPAFGAVALLAAVPLVIGTVALRASGQSAPLPRFLLGIAIVLGATGLLGLMRESLREAALMLTPWGRYAMATERRRREYRFVWSCISLTLALSVIWLCWWRVTDALEGTLIAVAAFVPILALTLDLAWGERLKRVAMASVTLVVGRGIVSASPDLETRPMALVWYLLPAVGALAAVCSEYFWEDLGGTSGRRAG
jgi:Tfp pilus assembly protein PilF